MTQHRNGDETFQSTPDVTDFLRSPQTNMNDLSVTNTTSPPESNDVFDPQEGHTHGAAGEIFQTNPHDEIYIVGGSPDTSCKGPDSQGVSPEISEYLPTSEPQYPPNDTPVPEESSRNRSLQMLPDVSQQLGIGRMVDSPILLHSSTEINVMLANLKLLSNVPVGTKLAVRNNTFIIHDKGSWSDMMVRIYNRDSREQVTHYLEQFVIHLANFMRDSQIDDATKLRIYEGIRASQNGLQHIKNTYYCDITTRTKIETIIENMMELLNTNQNQLVQPGATHPNIISSSLGRSPNTVFTTSRAGKSTTYRSNPIDIPVSSETYKYNNTY